MQFKEKTNAKNDSVEALPERSTVLWRENNRKRLYKFIQTQYEGNFTAAINEIVENYLDLEDMIEKAYPLLQEKPVHQIRYLVKKEYEKRTEANLSA